MKNVVVERCLTCKRYDKDIECPTCADSHTWILEDKLICLSCGEHAKVVWDDV